MKKQLLFVGAALLCLSNACSSDGDPNIDQDQTQPKTRVDIPLSKRQKEIMKSKRTFDFDFFRSAYANADGKTKNRFVVSPYSASVFMAMLAEGTADDVRAVMIKAFLGTEATVDELADMMKLMSESLADIDNTVKFKESNSIWYDNNVMLGTDFAKVVSQYFNAPSYQCDMYSTQTSKKINEWAKESTEGMIDRIFKDGESPESKAMLANAIYFRGKWTTPFDVNATANATFNNASGNKVTVDMMSEKRSMVGVVRDGVKVAYLPYGNAAFRMAVILPDGPVDEFIGNLTADFWKELEHQTELYEFDLKLPRYTVKCDGFVLNDALKSMGFETNFAQGTSYDRICNGLPGNALKVHHTAILKVDESGTEAASVTHNGMASAGGHEIKGYYEFTVDHPFIFLIEEISTRAVLFAGVVNEL